MKERLERLIGAADRWQRRHPPFSAAYGMLKKFGDDNANLYVVALGWYGFLAIYPLMLVVITVLGYIGAPSLGASVVRTLHQFPIIGSQLHPAGRGKDVHGSVLGLVIGLVGALYGAQGVTQVAEQAMSAAWDVPAPQRPSFAIRLGRSVGGLGVISFGWLLSAFVSSEAAASGRPLVLRIVLLVALAGANVGLYWAAFRLLTHGASTSARHLLPGSVIGGLGFTALITVGTGLVEHQLRNSSTTYGAFAEVIGVVTFLLLIAKLTLYAAELNPVLARHLHPRALPMMPPSEADHRALQLLVQQDLKRPGEEIDVRFAQDRPAANA